LNVGASIHACRASSRHIVALEEDEAIFKAILVPMVRPLSSNAVVAVPVDEDLTDSDEELCIVESIPKKSRFST